MDRQKRIKLAIERQRIKLEYLVEKDSSLEGLLAESQKLDRLIERYEAENTTSY
ncbi:Spo0E family sporulation regulatory protein-aspartic acid phosphatase [Lachnoclostridium sp. An196]|uniref:Spo0E family sporulation regulatory protein-aspartic acid phosphatase n=1 Tax=Lachnoclostridium sp. An196 TaxID=1965583 RepID=UPI00117ACC22|nr:Spo0E family sporulation regulatory protein-aspartic acid phosphatase [Lachnoclostridium sp. An196]